MQNSGLLGSKQAQSKSRLIVIMKTPQHNTEVVFIIQYCRISLHSIIYYIKTMFLLPSVQAAAPG
jgi:hypothetical protein